MPPTTLQALCHLPRRLRLLALPALMTLPSLARAQTAAEPAAAPPLKLGQYAVTGSHLKRLDQEKTLPVTVIDRDALEVRDASQPADLLVALPQVTGLPGNETATLGATARGDNSAISLRGLTSSNTLLLLNGRRLPPHPISQAEGSAPALTPNVNALPSRGLERIDVLRDGASSIYGTDAVAGVVNYLMRREFRGTELVLRYGETRYGDGAEARATLTHGFAFASGRGRGLLTLDVMDRAALHARDRWFAAEADNSYRAPAPWDAPTSTTFNLRSATSQYGNYTLGTVSGSGAFTAGRPSGIPASLAAASGQFFLVPTASGVGFQTTTPSRAGATHDYYWNNNAHRVLQPRSTRLNLFAGGEYDLSDRLTAFADFNGYRAHSLTYREPDGITASTDGNIIVPATNPFNPFGTRFWSPTGMPNADGTPRLTGTPAAVLIGNKRLVDLATRTATVDNTVYRGVAGLRGQLRGSWSWESALLYGEARVTDDEAGPSRKSLLVAALNQTDPTLAFNPFSRTFAVQNGTLAVTGPFANPESVQQAFRSHFVREGITKLGSWDFRAHGDAIDLWGGNRLGLAFGGEYRREVYDDFRPPFAGLNPPVSGLSPTANDFLGFSPNSDTHGNRHVTAAYAEVVLPLVGGGFKLPLVESLALTASARHESYTDFGATTKPKFGVSWQPFRWLMVRGSANEGFHAPNLAQLFTGELIRTLPGSTDTYRSTVTGQLIDGPSNRRTIASGNLSLKPEESKGKSAGVVVDVPFVPGLSLGVDYWEIRHTNVISSSGSIADDTALLLAATQAALAAGQSIGAIDLGSGTAGYRGDPAIVRLPVTPADRDFFAAYNAARAPGNQRAAVGAIDVIRSTFFNKAEEFVNGFDFDLTYRFPSSAAGRFTFNTAWTYLNDFHAYNAPGAPRTELREMNAFAVGGVTPSWRGHASLTWRRQQWGAGLAAYYTGTYTDANATTTRATYESLGSPGYIVPVFSNGLTTYRYKVRDSIMTNAYVSYRFPTKNRWTSGTAVRLGVVNLFDRVPPLTSDSRGYESSINTVMARGLAWSVQVTKTL